MDTPTDPIAIVQRGIEHHRAEIEREGRSSNRAGSMRERVVRVAIREARRQGRQSDHLGPIYVLAALRELDET